MKNKERTILCMLIATFILVPLMGNTAVAGTTTYCFSEYNPFIAWETGPWNMSDCDEDTYASTGISGDVENLFGPLTTGQYPGTITKVEIRTKGYYTGGQQGYINLTPIFILGRGNTSTFTPPQNNGNWSQWYDITNDPNAPSTWRLADIETLQCDVKSYIPDPAGLTCTLYCSIVQIRVTWT
jgi:hypothetical protein